MNLTTGTFNGTDAKNVGFTHQASNHIIGVKQDGGEDFLCSATKNQYCSGNELLLSFKKPFTDIEEVRGLFEFTRNYLEGKIPNNYTASLRGSDGSIISDFSQLIGKSSFIADQIAVKAIMEVISTTTPNARVEIQKGSINMGRAENLGSDILKLSKMEKQGNHTRLTLNSPLNHERFFDLCRELDPKTGFAGIEIFVCFGDNGSNPIRVTTENYGAVTENKTTFLFKPNNTRLH